MSTPGIADDPLPLSTGDTSENLQTPATDSQRPTENPPAENEQPVEKILDTQTDQAADQCESPSIPKETTPVEAKASPEVTNPVKASVAKKILNPSATAFKPKLEAPVKAPKNKAQVNLSKENNENKKASPNKKEDQSKAVNQQSNVARKSSTTAMNKAIPHHQLLHHNVGRLGVIPPTSNHQMYVPLHHHHHHHGLMMMPGDPSMINMILMGQPPGTLASPPLMPNHLMQQYLQHPAGPANPMMLVPNAHHMHHHHHMHQHHMLARGMPGYPFSVGNLTNDYIPSFPMGYNPALRPLLVNGAEAQGQPRQPHMMVPPGMNPMFMVPNTLTPNMDTLARQSVSANQFILDQHNPKDVTGAGVIPSHLQANPEGIPHSSKVSAAGGFVASTAKGNKGSGNSTPLNPKKSVETKTNQNSKITVGGVCKPNSPRSNSIVKIGNAAFAALREGPQLHCVVIVGLPSSGKTTVGRQLIQELSEENNRWEFFSGGDFIGENNVSKSNAVDSGVGPSRGDILWCGEGGASTGVKLKSDRSASWDTTKVVLDALSTQIDRIKATNCSLDPSNGSKLISGLLIDKNMKGIEDLYYLAALLHEKHVHLTGIVSFESEDDSKLLERLEFNESSAIDREDRVEEMKEKYRFYRVILSRIQDCTKLSGLWKKIDATKSFNNVVRDLRIQVLGSYSIRHNVKRINSTGYGDKCCTMIDNYREYARIMGEIMWYMSGKGLKTNQFPGLVNFTPLTVAAWQEKRTKMKIKENCVARRKIEGSKYILFHNNCKLYLVPRHMNAVLQISADAWVGTSPLSSLGPFILDGEVATLIEDPGKEKFFVYDVLFWAIGKTIHTDACKTMSWDDRQSHLSKELLSEEVRGLYKPGVDIVIVHQPSKPLIEVPALLKRGECSAEGLVFQSTSYTGDVFLWRPPHTLSVDLRLAKMVSRPSPSNGSTAEYEVEVFDPRFKRYLHYARFGNLDIQMPKLSQKPPVEGSLVSCGIDPSEEDSELLKTPLSPSGITRKGNYTIVDGSWMFFCTRHDIIITTFRGAVDSLFDDGVVPEHLLLSWFRQEQLIPPLPGSSFTSLMASTSSVMGTGQQIMNPGMYIMPPRYPMVPGMSTVLTGHSGDVSCSNTPFSAPLLQGSSYIDPNNYQKGGTLLGETANANEADPSDRKGLGIALSEHSGGNNILINPTSSMSSLSMISNPHSSLASFQGTIITGTEASKMGSNADFTLLGHAGGSGAVHDPVGRLRSMISSGAARCDGNTGKGTDDVIDMFSNINIAYDPFRVEVQGDPPNDEISGVSAASKKKDDGTSGDNKCDDITSTLSSKRKCSDCRNSVPTENGRVDRNVSSSRDRPFYCFPCWAKEGYEFCECGNFSKGRRSEEKEKNRRGAKANKETIFYCDRCWRKYETSEKKRLEDMDDEFHGNDKDSRKNNNRNVSTNYSDKVNSRNPTSGSNSTSYKNDTMGSSNDYRRKGTKSRGKDRNGDIDHK